MVLLTICVGMDLKYCIHAFIVNKYKNVAVNWQLTNTPIRTLRFFRLSWTRKLVHVGECADAKVGFARTCQLSHAAQIFKANFRSLNSFKCVMRAPLSSRALQCVQRCNTSICACNYAAKLLNNVFTYIFLRRVQ